MFGSGQTFYLLPSLYHSSADAGLKCCQDTTSNKSLPLWNYANSLVTVAAGLPPSPSKIISTWPAIRNTNCPNFVTSNYAAQADVNRSVRVIRQEGKKKKSSNHHLQEISPRSHVHENSNCQFSLGQEKIQSTVFWPMDFLKVVVSQRYERAVLYFLCFRNVRRVDNNLFVTCLFDYSATHLPLVLYHQVSNFLFVIEAPMLQKQLISVSSGATTYGRSLSISTTLQHLLVYYDYLFTLMAL